MNTLKQYLLILLTVATLAACKDDDDETTQTAGTVGIEFDNMVGTSELSLATEGSTDYKYTNEAGQTFNITSLQYYISKIILTGPNGERFEDELNVSANADEIKGYYFIKESDGASKIIELENVPAGTYTHITFNVGIDEEGVQEGAAGGILDPAAGAPFWSWNAGYIAMTVEGQTAANAEPAFAIHVGGWKDIVPTDGTTQKFYNNVKTLTLSLDENMKVSSTVAPEIHIVADVLEVLGDNDFTVTSAVHSPAGGRTFADRFANAFVVDHVHQ